MKIRFLPLLFLLFFTACENITQPVLTQPIIVFTFDDQHISIYENALPILQKYGFTATNFVNTNSLGKPDRLTWQHLEYLEKDLGWETGGHTLNHVNLPECDETTAVYEISQDKQNLLEHGLEAVSFALPSGHATPQQFRLISEYYKNIRTSLDIQHKKINRKFLGYFAYQSTYNAQNAIGRIIRGLENNEILIILGFHQVSNDLESHPSVCSPEAFEEIVEFVKKNNLPVKTLKNAIGEICR
ncbi:MAG: polysaccharide deacetylase family protein [Candidatus Cloacimonadota bacterium]|nr:polysaccharide deacetylase family protein [Candidatus Cloacimonadota bacterium]